MALPDALLGSNLKTYFDQDYTSGTGTFVDAKGNATTFTQATEGNRPAWNTTTAPSGRGLLSFDGNDFLTGGNIPTGVLPAWSGSSVQWVEFAIFVRAHTGSTLEIMVGYDGVDYLALTGGATYRFGCYGDNVLSASTVYRWIAVHDPAVGFVASLVNGVVQGDTETPNSGVRTQWVGPKSLGGQSNGASPFMGLLGCIGYAAFTSTITISDLYALDTAMQEWWTTAPSGGGTTISLAAPAAEQRRSSLIVVPENLIVLPRGLAEERRAAVSSLSVTTAALPAARAEEARAALAALATYTATLSAPRREEAAASVAALSSYGVTLAGVGSGPMAPAPGSQATNTIVLAVPSTEDKVGTLSAAPGPVTIALAAILSSERSGTLTVVVGGGAPQTVVLAAPSASELRGAVAVAASITAVLAAPAVEGRSPALATLATFAVGLARPAAEGAAPPATALPTYAAALPATSAEQRAGAIVAASVLVAQLAAPAAEERRAGVAQESSYAVALAPAASTQATSFVTAGEFITITCALHGIPSASRIPTVGVTSTLPAPSRIRVSFRPATTITVTQRPATSIRVRQHRAAQITVRQRMIFHVGDVNVLVIEFRHWKTNKLTDPTTFDVVVTAPSGTVTTLTLGSSSNIERAEEGIFECSIPLPEPEDWSFDILSPGPAVPGAQSGTFTVRRSRR